MPRLKTPPAAGNPAGSMNPGGTGNPDLAWAEINEDWGEYGGGFVPHIVPGYNAPIPEPDAAFIDTSPRWREGGLSSRGQSLRTMWESMGPIGCIMTLKSCLENGRLRPNDFSLKEIALAFCGRNWYERLNPMAINHYGPMNVMEAGEGVDVSAFSNITGQIFYNKILEGWRNATLVTDQIFDTFNTNLDGEKMPWLSHVIQEGQPIHPGMPYPEANFGERYITTPSTTKWGMIVSVTKEMIFFDRTGQAMRAAGETGYKLGYNKEKRNLATFLGLVNTYSLNGTTFNTYLTGPQSPPAYANSQTGVPLVDYSSIQAAMTLASQILDPDTLNPLDNIEIKDIFVLPARLLHARALARATEYWATNPAFNSSTPASPPYGNLQMHSPNPVGSYSVLTSNIAYQLLVNGSQVYAPGYTPVTSVQANDMWWTGDFKRSFTYMQNWPITVVQAPNQSIKEFEQDIVVRFKASERGTPAVMDPRYVFFMRNT